MKTIVDRMADPSLYGAVLGPLHTWKPGWVPIVKVISRLPLDTEDERRAFKKLTGRRWTVALLKAPLDEVLVLAGRGSGKTIIGAMLMLDRAAFYDYSAVLRGRRGRVLLLASDREQAEEAMDSVSLFFDKSPALASMIAPNGRTKSRITLKNGITIQIKTATARGIRGPAVVAALCDELCFWPREPSQNSDLKILRALRPALAKVPGSLLVSISSTGARSGVAFDLWERYHGKDSGSVLVFQAPSLALNPLIDKRKIARDYEEDPYSARAEWGSEWFDSESEFVDRARVRVIEGRREQIPPRHVTVHIGMDVNGGSETGDAFAMAAAHVEGSRIVLDFVHSQKGRTDPTQVAEEFAAILRPYRARLSVFGDRYAAAWPRRTFAKLGVEMHPPHRAPGGRGRMSASDYLLALLPNLARVDWLDHKPLLRELFDLIRTPEGVRHPSRGHDDMAVAVVIATYGAGLELETGARYERDEFGEMRPVSQTEDADDEEAAEDQNRLATLIRIALANGYTEDTVAALLSDSAICTCVPGTSCPLHVLQAAIREQQQGAQRLADEEEDRAYRDALLKRSQPAPATKPDAQQQIAVLEDLLYANSMTGPGGRFDRAGINNPYR